MKRTRGKKASQGFAEDLTKKTKDQAVPSYHRQALEGEERKGHLPDIGIQTSSMFERRSRESEGQSEKRWNPRGKPEAKKGDAWKDRRKRGVK